MVNWWIFSTGDVNLVINHITHKKKKKSKKNSSIFLQNKIKFFTHVTKQHLNFFYSSIFFLLFYIIFVSFFFFWLFLVHKILKSTIIHLWILFIWSIHFNDISARIGLFYAEKLGNHVHCTFTFTFFEL